MKSDRFARVKEILVAIADLSEALRTAYLGEACRSDPDLRREVESILSHEHECAISLTNLGRAVLGQGKMMESERIFQEAMARRQPESTDGARITRRGRPLSQSTGKPSRSDDQARRPQPQVPVD